MDRYPFAKHGWALFQAVGAVILSWRLAPPLAGHWGLWVAALLLAVFGTSRIVAAFRLYHRTRAPRPLSPVPPVWLSTWAVIIGVALTFGTPHVRIDRSWERCSYIGWNGLVQIENKTCTRIQLIPLPTTSNQGGQ